MEPIQLNVIDAIRAREGGIQRAAESTERKVPGWKDAAYEVLLRYLDFAPDTFMIEDIRASEFARGLEEPSHPRAWGGVTRRAVKDGLIEHAGVGRTRAEGSHNGYANLWRRKQ